MSERLAIFCGDTLGVPDILLRATLAAVDARTDVEVGALILPSPTSRFRRAGRYLRVELMAQARAWLDPARHRRRLPSPVAIEREAARRRFEVIVADGRHGDEALARRLRALGCTLALSFYWRRRFDDRLLGVFDVAVNYHNGLLPRHRGLRATAWSVYDGDPVSGYTFHRMTPVIDGGAVLIDGGVAVASARSTVDLDFAKALDAASRVPEALRMMVERAPGVPQAGSVRYHSGADVDAMTRIERPGDLTFDELRRRVRAFGLVRLAIGGAWHPVTRLDPVSDAGPLAGPLAFRTADGVAVAATRLRYLPPALYRLGRRLALVDD